MPPEMQDLTKPKGSSGHTLRDQLQGALDAGAFDGLSDPVEGEEIEVSVRPTAQAAPAPQTTDPSVSAEGFPETPVPPTSTPVPPDMLQAPEPVAAEAEMQGPQQPGGTLPSLENPPAYVGAEPSKFDINPPDSPASLPTGTPAPTKEMVKSQEKRHKEAQASDVHRKQAEGESKSIKQMREKFGDPVGPEGSGWVDDALKGPKVGGFMTPEQRMAREAQRRSMFDTQESVELARGLEAGTAQRGEERSEREMQGNFSKDIRGLREQGVKFGTPITMEPIDAYTNTPEEVASWLNRAQQAVASDHNAKLAINQVIPFAMEAAKAGAGPETLLDGMYSVLEANNASIPRDQFDRLMGGTNEVLMDVAARAIQDKDAKILERRMRVGALNSQQLALDNQLLRTRMALDDRNLHEYERQAFKATQIRDDIMGQLTYAQGQLEVEIDRHNPNNPLTVGPMRPEVFDRHQATISELQQSLQTANRKISESETMAAEAGVRADRRGPSGAYTEVKLGLFNQYLNDMIMEDIASSPQVPGAMHMQEGKARRALSMMTDPMLRASPEGQALIMEYTQRLRKELENQSSLSGKFSSQLRDMYLHDPESTEGERTLRLEYWNQMLMEDRSEP